MMDIAISPGVTAPISRADGGTYSVHVFLRAAFGKEHLQKSLNAAARADKAEVGRLRALEYLAQAVGVVSMAARYDNDIVVGGNFELPYAVFKAVAQHLCSIGEASLICKRRPVIAHIHFKSAFAANSHTGSAM